MITNRHKSRVLNEILALYTNESFILYGTSDSSLDNDILTMEQDVLIQGLEHYGVVVEKVILCARKIEISLILIP
jgi:hypothetical protein